MKKVKTFEQSKPSSKCGSDSDELDLNISGKDVFRELVEAVSREVFVNYSDRDFDRIERKPDKSVSFKINLDLDNVENQESITRSFNLVA